MLHFRHLKRELLSHRLRKAKALGLWIPRPLSSPLTLQSGVLFGRQLQEYATATGGDRLVQHEPALLICKAAAPLYQLDHLGRGREVQLPGKGSLQMLLEELALPSIPE